MITSEKIKSLREKTGAGMMDCKKALVEVQGDLESAIDWLRKKGISTAAKKSTRDASDGLITILQDESNICILEVNSETDFVARNDDFQDFCLKLSKTILSYKINKIGELLDLNFLEKLNDFATYDIDPNITFYIDVTAETAHERSTQNNLDRIESVGLEFQNSVREKYLYLAEKFKTRIVTIDGNQSIPIIHSTIWKKTINCINEKN